MNSQISVVVPVYNSERFLNECINSILNQTYKNLEVILIDDGSTDSSPRICDEFAAKDSRVWVVHQMNSGVSAARNKGLDMATGDYITFVDSDDCIEPDMYETLLILLQEKDVEIAHCGYKRVSETGEPLKEVSGTHQVLIHSGLEAVNNMLSGKLYVCGLWNKLFNRRLFDNIRFNTELAINEDVLVAFLVFQKAKKTVFMDETMYHYRIYDESVCNTTLELKKIKDSLKATNLMISSCEDPEIMQILINRRYECISGWYSWCIFHTRETEKQEVKRVRKETKVAYREAKGLPRSTRIKYGLMVGFPTLYKYVYQIYDKTRVPNWDVK